MVYVLFIIGFVFLIKGADVLVEGASSIAKKFKVSDLVIGLTIVAFGTSAPELVVNIMASLKGSAGIAIGNILGSNISNILLILGVSAIVYPLSVKKTTTFKEIPFSLLAVIILGIVANDVLIDGAILNGITRIDGLVLLGFFAIFLYYVFSTSKSEESPEVDVKKMSMWKSILFIALGLVGLTLGGKWIVDGAIHIATILGMSETVIGLTIVAVGTSLPELATCVVAAMKKKSDIAIGNVVGSNIFNIFWILGLSATINPLPFQMGWDRDIIMTIIATFLLFLFILIGKKESVIDKYEGIIMLVIYIIYVSLLVVGVI
ncbi:calcium/sodium antiporter [Candidatus Gracilibacteria bacterium]|nr:calcium/sodium antiporter [Candidatus Gracilibacteria bacterium]